MSKYKDVDVERNFIFVLMKVIKLLIITLSFSTAQAQTVENPKDAVLINPYAGYQFYGGDLGTQYGPSVKLGLGVGYKFTSDLILNIETSYSFGNNVKNSDEILGNLTTADGQIINESGNYARYSLFHRGLTYGANFQKVFTKYGVNKNSGPLAEFGVGYTWNWTRLENVGNDSPNLINDYTKGYDQLTAGPYLKQGIGYLYLSANKRINLGLTFEIYEAFTKNLRTYNYSGGYYSDKSRLDLIYSFRLNWFLPIYQGGKSQYYYN